MRYLALVIPSMRYAVSQGYNRIRQEEAGLVLGGLSWPLRHASRRRPRRAFGDRPLITCQGLSHALALLRLLLFRPDSPRHELLLLHELLLFPHGVPLRPLYRDSIVALCPGFAFGNTTGPMQEFASLYSYQAVI